MNAPWRGTSEPVRAPIGPAGWLRVVWRAPVLFVVVFGGLAVLLLLRLVERPLCGLQRPVTPHITRMVCRTGLVILGIRLSIEGRPLREPGAMVANHASWLDIFALNAPHCLYFVSKAEVAGWPAIGSLARATGTVFINRRGRDAQIHKAIFEARLRANHRLLFFPEGTSTDGQQVLPFKTTLFGAFFSPDLREMLHVQPISVNYRAPSGSDPRLYGWWGGMNFAPHLLQVLAAPLGGQVALHYHAPVAVAKFGDRKELAAYCEARVREGLRPAISLQLRDRDETDHRKQAQR